jgi:class 3 adenylate cyclase
VVLTGDEGIGKSRVVGQLIAEARDAGVRPFAGRCLQDSAVPLLSLAAFLDSLGSGPPGTTSDRPGASLDDTEHSVALVVSTGRALMAAAADRPVLLVLEDAQWADQATIELVAHIAATLAHEAVFRELPVMLLVTAREVGAAPAAQRLLSRLTRDTIGRTLRLGRLDDLDLFALLQAHTGTRPSTALLSLARDVTSGNPLEVEALLARLDRAGALERRGRELTTTIDDVSALPPELDVDAEPAARIDALTEPARRLLTTLALLRDGRVSTLSAAADLTADEVDTALDEVVAAGLVVEEGLRIDFVERLTARALVRSVGVRRRQRLHAEIARRLAATESTSFVVSEIADQLLRAGSAADPTLLADYAGRAGDEAMRLGAWGDAQRHYRAALSGTTLDDESRAVFEHRAAIAAHRNLDRAEAAAHAARAVELARRSDDVRTWGEAALLGSRAASETHLLREFLDDAGSREPALRARAHATLSELSFDRLEFEDAAAHAEEAERIARETDDPGAAARIEFVVALQQFGSLDLAASVRTFRRCEDHARRVGDPLVQCWAMGRLPLVRWSMGALDDAADAAADVADRNRASGWWSEYSLVSAARAGIAVSQGNLGGAERSGAEAASAHRRSEQRGVAAMLWSALANARMLLGDLDGAHAALDEWVQEDPRPAFLYRAVVDAFLSSSPETTRASDFPALVRPDARIDLTSLSLAGAAVEIADALQRPEVAAHALAVLDTAYERGARFTPGWSMFVPRLAGVACLLAGSHADAERWLRIAETDAETSGAAGEVARVGYDLARTRLAAGSDVGVSLTDAIRRFERLGFRPLLRAARRLAGWSEFEPTWDSGSTRVIMVTDIVDSTPLTRRVGDHRFVELLREHNRIVRTRLRQFDGVEFKHTGDGIAAWFLTAGAAVECGLRIQEDLERANAARHDPVVVRIGIAAGDVVKEESDVYGLAVITAFRVCDHATPGRVLVSEDLPRLVRDADIGFASVGRVVLKGFSDPHPLFEVVPASPAS